MKARPKSKSNRGCKRKRRDRKVLITRFSWVESEKEKLSRSVVVCFTFSPGFKRMVRQRGKKSKKRSSASCLLRLDYEVIKPREGTKVKPKEEVYQTRCVDFVPNMATWRLLMDTAFFKNDEKKGDDYDMRRSKSRRLHLDGHLFYLGE